MDHLNAFAANRTVSSPARSGSTRPAMFGSMSGSSEAGCSPTPSRMSSGRRARSRRSSAGSLRTDCSCRTPVRVGGFAYPATNREGGPLMHANVRFEHQLLAIESEHTVNGMLELQAPPLPKAVPARRCTSRSSSTDRARWPDPSSRSPASAPRSWSGGSRRRRARPGQLRRGRDLLAPLAPVDQARSCRGSARSTRAARRTCPAGG